MIERELPGARVAFSTRQGGVSGGPYESLNLGVLTGDDVELVAENRRRLAQQLGIARERVAMGWQVHGTELYEWNGAGADPGAPTSGFASPDAPLPRVDGHVTSAAGLALLVLVADCLPLALAAPGRAAMLHCGWRGVAGGIVERGVTSFGEPPAAVVGPGIAPCCYEVGPDVLQRFGSRAGAPASLDLRAALQERLEAVGVERIEHVDLCTSCNRELFFSHRRDGGVTGRQAGLVWLTP